MLRTHLHDWRATLFVTLGLSAGACGGVAEGPSDETSGPGPDETTPVEDYPQENAVTLAEHLRCLGSAPSEQDPTVQQCSNGIVHRPEPPEPAPEPCEGCAPRGPMLHGVVDACASDGDCPTGALCILSTELQTQPVSCDGTFVGDTVSEVRRYFACQQTNDQCGVDVQCGSDEVCAVTGGGRHCQPLHYTGCAVPGRPFLVAGAARLASVCARADWAGAALEPARALSPAVRATLAEYWLAAARQEHASVAAFARFTLQLMELGAPFELCEQSQRAMRDETEHARRCFALASRYFGAALGPGALKLDGALTETSLAAVARLTFIEGCVGETCAALEAAEAFAFATDAEVRRALEVIAQDERRHAELAWRFIAWALESDLTGDVRQELQLELKRLRARAAAPGAEEAHLQAAPADAKNDAVRATASARPPEHASHLTGHGRLGSEQRRLLSRVAIAEVVLPCMDRLLASHSSGLRSARLSARSA